MGMLIAPIILFVLVGAILIFSIVSTVSIVAQGGTVEYSESELQEYAGTEYAKAFKSLPDRYEDNLVIVFTVYEDYDGYECIAYCGYNLDYRINEMLGSEGSDFYEIVRGSINENYYQNSLTTDFVAVSGKLSERIQRKNLDSSFTSAPTSTEAVESHLVNYTDLVIDSTTVNAALQKFTQETGIPVVIVVETGENVFGRTIPVLNIVILVVLIGALIFLGYVIIRNVVRKKREQIRF